MICWSSGIFIWLASSTVETIEECHFSRRTLRELHPSVRLSSNKYNNQRLPTFLQCPIWFLLRLICPSSCSIKFLHDVLLQTLSNIFFISSITQNMLFFILFHQFSPGHSIFPKGPEPARRRSASCRRPVRCLFGLGSD